MQTTDILSRWREPGSWRQPGRIALANIARVDTEETMQATLIAGGADLVPTPLRDHAGQVTDAVAESDVVISGGARLDEEFFGGLRSTRLLVRPYVGYDDIDVAAATAHGVLVANVPDAITEDVANQAMALIMAVNRQVLREDSFVRSGGWARTRSRFPDGMVLHRPTSQVLGLIGLGNIGRATALRARPFGFRMLAHDPYIDASAAEELGVDLVSLEELLRQSDVVSVHVFLSDETRHLINAERLALMKPTAWLVNTARGKVVDEEALVAALIDEKLGGAALDVMEEEPLQPDSPLVELDNVILSPHVAGFSEEGITQLRTRAAEIALQVAGGGLPQRHVVINKGLFDEIAGLSELATVKRH
jgi:D-3-phosphoglycerate dehydrogenase